MSDCMQFSATIYTERDNNPGVHSLLTRVHKSEVHIVSKLYGTTITIMFRHEVSMKSALLACMYAYPLGNETTCI